MEGGREKERSPVHQIIAQSPLELKLCQAEAGVPDICVSHEWQRPKHPSHYLLAPTGKLAQRYI